MRAPKLHDAAGMDAAVNEFFDKYRGQQVPMAIAEDYFARFRPFTRPLWQTLGCYGCVVRPANGLKWSHPMREAPWVYCSVLDALRPADLPQSNTFREALSC